MVLNPRSEQPNSAQPPMDEGALREALKDFETRLSSRTRVPADKMSDYMRLPEEQLDREAHTITRVLKRFAEAVVESMEKPQKADTFLRELDLKSVSRDHDWRAIFSTIRAQEDGYEDFKRAVLVKYLQYLSFRKRLVEFIRAGRQGLEETDEFSDFALKQMPLESFGLDVKSNSSPTSGLGANDYMRLPLGESMTVKLAAGGKINLMLAGHSFRLTGASPPSLIDQNGVMYFLKEGRNMVGRHPESDMVIDADFNDVSRAHLIIEWDGQEKLAFLDLSSLGTFVRADALGGDCDN